jgi:hypothetical protein
MFFIGIASFYIPTSNVPDSKFFAFFQHLLFSVVAFNNSHPSGCEVIISCVLICISLISDIKHLFCVLISYLYIFGGEMSNHVLCLLIFIVGLVQVSLFFGFFVFVLIFLMGLGLCKLRTLSLQSRCSTA